MRKFWKKGFTLLLGTLLAVSLIGCGSSADGTGSTAGGSGTANIVNIGVTGSLVSFNPFVMDMSEMNHYSSGLMFLPLVELDQNLNFVPMLADSITTEDNLTFTVHIDDAATWSDGTPVTAADVEYTVRRLCSPVVANPYMMYYVFEGVDDETGFVEENADSVAGIRIVDDKTITFTVKSPMSLISFENGYARYMHILPKHVIEKFSEAELTTNECVSHPDVVRGHYICLLYTSPSPLDNVLSRIPSCA